MAGIADIFADVKEQASGPVAAGSWVEDFLSVSPDAPEIEKGAAASRAFEGAFPGLKISVLDEGPEPLSGGERFNRVKKIFDNGMQPLESEDLKAWRALGEDREAKLKVARDARGFWEAAGSKAAVAVANVQPGPYAAMGGRTADGGAAAQGKEDDKLLSWYEAKLESKNWLGHYKAMAPDLSERAQKVVQAGINKGGIQADQVGDFMALDQKEADQVSWLVHSSRPAGSRNFVRDAGYAAGGMVKRMGLNLWAQAERLDAALDGRVVNPAYAALGQRFESEQSRRERALDPEARDELRRMRLLLRETNALKPYENYGLVEDAIIGAAGTIPYMAVAAVPYVGLAVITLDTQQGIYDRVLMEGGNPHDALAAQYAVSFAIAAVERLSAFTAVGKPLTTLGRQQLYMNFARHGRAYAARQLGGEVALATSAQTFEEMVQAGMEEGLTAGLLDRDVVAEATRGFVQEARTWNTMLVLGAGGTGIKGAVAKRARLDAESVVDFAARRLKVRKIMQSKPELDGTKQTALFNEARKAWAAAGSMKKAADAMEGLGFDRDQAVTMVDFFSYESAAEGSADPVARYLARMEGLDVERMFADLMPGAEVEVIEGGYRVSFTVVKDGVSTERSYVIKTGAGEFDVNSAAFAVSVEEATGGAVTAEEYLAKSEEERAQVRESKGLNPKGSFTAAEVVTPEGTALPAEALVQLVTVAPEGAEGAVNSDLFHEHFHGMISFARDAGVLDDADFKQLVEMFGPGRVTGELFNEEAGALSFSAWMTGQEAGKDAQAKGVAKIAQKVRDWFAALFRRLGWMPVDESVREQQRERVFNAIRTGDFSGFSAMAGVEVVKDGYGDAGNNAGRSNKGAGDEGADAVVNEAVVSEAVVNEAGAYGDGEQGAGGAEAAAPGEASEQPAAGGAAVDKALPVESKAKRAGKAERPPVVRVSTPTGGVNFGVRWQAVELDDLVTSDMGDYPAELQPRNRSTVSSRVQIFAIAKEGEFDPARLMESAESDGGSPIMAGGGAVLSGNGRTMALRELDKRGRWGEYYGAAAEKAAELGIDLEGMRRPVLVRRVVQIPAGSSLEQIAELSNRSKVLNRSTAELARADAKAIIEGGLLAVFDPGADVNLMAKSNNAFMQAFAKAAGAEGLLDSKGQPTEELALRVRRALLSGVIADEALQRMLLEQSGELGVKNILKALIAQAGAVLQLERDKPAVAVADELSNAVGKYLRMRSEGWKSLGEYLAQADLLEGTVGEIEGLVLAAIEVDKLPAFLARYVELAQRVEGGGGDADMFGHVTRAVDVVRQVAGEMELGGGARFSVDAGAMDRSYMDAVEGGDLERAQRLVETAARRAGYDSPVVFHGTGKKFNAFSKLFGGSITEARSARRAFFFSDNDRTARAYAQYAAETGPVKEMLKKADAAERRGDWDKYDEYLQEAERLDTRESSYERRDDARVISAYLKGRFYEFDAGGKTPQELSADGNMDGGLTALLADARRGGYDGVIIRNLDDAVGLNNVVATHYAVFASAQIKQSDAVTRDDAGKVIPLSKRFDVSRDDMRYSVGSGMVAPEAPESDFPEQPRLAANRKGLTMPQRQALFDKRHAELDAWDADLKRWADAAPAVLPFASMDEDGSGFLYLVSPDTYQIKGYPWRYSSFRIQPGGVIDLEPRGHSVYSSKVKAIKDASRSKKYRPDVRFSVGLSAPVVRPESLTALEASNYRLGVRVKKAGSGWDNLRDAGGLSSDEIEMLGLRWMGRGDEFAPARVAGRLSRSAYDRVAAAALRSGYTRMQFGVEDRAGNWIVEPYIDNWLPMAKDSGAFADAPGKYEIVTVDLRSGAASVRSSGLDAVEAQDLFHTENYGFMAGAKKRMPEGAHFAYGIRSEASGEWAFTPPMITSTLERDDVFHARPWESHPPYRGRYSVAPGGNFGNIDGMNGKRSAGLTKQMAAKKELSDWQKRYNFTDNKAKNFVPNPGGSSGRFSVGFGRDPKGYIAAMVSAEIMAGVKVGVSDVEKVLKNVGEPLEAAPVILSAAQEKAAGATKDVIAKSAAVDRPFLEKLAGEFEREYYLGRVVESFGEGAKAAGRGVKAAQRVEQAVAKAAQRALDTAAGYSAAEMMAELAVDLSGIVLQMSDVKLSAEEAELRRRIADQARVARDAAEAAAAEGVDPAAVTDPDGKVRALVDELLRIAKVQAGAAKGEREMDAVQRLQEMDAAALDLDGAAVEGEDEAEISGPAEIVRLLAPVISDPDEFAAFVLEWATRKISAARGEPDRAKLYKNPAAVRDLIKTVQHILGKLAVDLVGTSAGRIDAEKDIARMGELRDARKVYKEIGYIYGRIHKAALRKSRKELVGELVDLLKEQALDGKAFQARKVNWNRKTAALVEVWARNIISVVYLSDEKIEVLKRQLEKDIEDAHKTSTGTGMSLDDDKKYVESLDKLAVLGEFGGMVRWMPGRIMDAAESVAEDLLGRRAEFEEARLEWKEKTLKMRSKLTKAVERDKSVKQPEVGYGAELVDSLMGNVELRLQHLIRFSKGQERADGLAVIEEIMFQLGRSAEKYRKIQVEGHARLHDALKGIYGAAKKGLKHLDEKIPDAAQVQLSTQGVQLTYGQALQLYGSILQEFYVQNVRSHGRQGDLAILRGVLSAQDMALYNWMVGWYRDNRARLSEVQEQITGLKILSPDFFYLPVKMFIESSGLDDRHVAWTPLLRTLTPRVKNQRDFDEQADIVSMFTSRLGDSALTVAYGQTGLFLSEVLGAASFQVPLVRFHGKHYRNELMDQIGTTLRGGQSVARDSRYTGTINEVRGWISRIMLSGNMMSALKQLASAPVWACVLPVSDVLKYMTHIDMGAVKELMQSDGYIARYRGGWSVETTNIMQLKGENLLQKIYDKGLIVNSVFDFVPGVWIAQGLYRDLKAKFEDQGYTKDEAKERAQTITWNYLEQTQQSGRVENTVSFIREGGAGMKLLTQFANSPLQQLQFTMEAAREVKAGTPGAKGRLIKALVINNLILPFLFGSISLFWSGLLGKDEPPDDKFVEFMAAALLGPANRVFLLGAMSERGIRTLLGEKEKYGRGGLLPAESAVGIVGQAAEVLRVAGLTGADAITPGDLTDLTYEDLLAELNRLGKRLAAPYRHASQAVENRR